MTMTTTAPVELFHPDDSIRATFEEILAATTAGKTARLEGRGPAIDSTIEDLIGERSHMTAHRTRDLLTAWRRGWKSAAPRHRAEPTPERSRSVVPFVVLGALATVPTSAVIAMVVALS